MLLVLALVSLGLMAPISPATAVQAAHTQIVAAIPSGLTPEIRDGRVLTMVKVGNKIIVGGAFTQVANRNGGTAYTRNNIFAFDATTGNVDTAFAPTINGVVNVLLAGAGNTVYAGGTFTSVNGAIHRNLVSMDAATGVVTPGFKAASLNGAVNDLALSGGRLYVGGTFTTAAAIAHGGLVTLSPTTGLVDPYMDIDLTVNHNYDGTGARAAVGTSKLDISPDGTRLVVIGNFKLADGLSRDQAVLISLDSGVPVVDPNWRTARYEPACFRNAFDSYVRDVDFAPDGSWFSIVATGGPNPGTLCDTATRWEIVDTGQDVQPRWIADTGGDTLFSVAITGTAVYVGGHQRWMNNAGGTDRAAAGAVPRPGLAALDPLNGVPLLWNPGRNPRGVGAQALLATPDGLYVGSDTEYIGNFQYLRPRIAYFPLAGGTAPASQDTGSLPANVFMAGRETTGAPPQVLYRVNAGGLALASQNGGPDWAQDTLLAPSAFHNAGSVTAQYPATAAMDSTVPAGTPSAIFSTERTDPGFKGDGGEMTWGFPVASGTLVEARLYFANRCACTNKPNQRTFDVTLEGSTVLDNFDIRKQVSDQTGTMRSFTFTSDGTVNLTWGHEKSDPLINAIEIIDRAPVTGGIGVNDVVKRYLDGSTLSLSQTLANPDSIEWSRARGAFMAGGKVVYGWSDGNLYTRTFDGTTFGPAVLVDPYNDAFWSTIDTGSNQTYRGVKPSLYAQLPTVTGMAYSGGQLYYTKSGQQGLFHRGMSLDSLIVAPDEHVVAGSTGWADVQGMFISGNSIYWASRIDGNLRQIAFVNGVPTGATTVISGPILDGNDWRSRTMFLGPGGPPPPNQVPRAAFSSACQDLTCSFDAAGSADSDGTIVSYSWTFGDDTGGSGVTTSHAYASAGTKSVTLTVTDNLGATDTVTAQVSAGQTNVAPVASFTTACDGRSCSFDGTASSDSDGTVDGYSWDFGDGNAATGVTAMHTYAAAGDHLVTLVVTDNNGSTGSTTRLLTVNSFQTISFRASATPYAAVGVTSARVTIPTSVQPGDGLILVLTTNSAVTGALPTGFTAVGTQTGSTTITTQAWQKVATAEDAGRLVTIPLSGSAKVNLELVAYAGTSQTAPVASFTGASDVGGSSHTTPTASAPPGAWVLSVWSDKSASARTFTAPASVTVRDSLAGVGTGDVATLVADSGQAMTGQVGGLTATVSAASTRATMLTIVLAPAS